MLDYQKWLKLEGGNAVSNVTRINQENVEATLKKVYAQILPLLKITKQDIRLLGSTGKRNPGGTSGDIDMAVSVQAMVDGGFMDQPEEENYTTRVIGMIGAAVKKKFPNAKAMPGIGVVSLAFPIENTDGFQEDKFVQLDLMLSDDLDFSSFAFHSPYEKDSAYKGVYRNLIMIAIAGAINREIISSTRIDDKDVPDTWSRFWYDNKMGFSKGIQTIRGPKGLLKNPKSVEKTSITKVPLEIIKFLLGPTFTVADANSFESIWKAIKSPKFIHKKLLPVILPKYKDTLTDMGLPIPPEID